MAPAKKVLHTANRQQQLAQELMQLRCQSCMQRHGRVANQVAGMLLEKASRQGENAPWIELPSLAQAARDFLLEEQPQVVVQVADATTLKRHLNLFLQLAEMEQPLVLAVNKMDVARKNNLSLDIAGLQACLGVPVVPISAKTGQDPSPAKRLYHPDH